MITQSSYPSFAHSSRSTPSPVTFHTDLIFSTTLLLPSTATHAVGIQNAAATREKQDTGLHKGNTGSHTGQKTLACIRGWFTPKRG